MITAPYWNSFIAEVNERSLEFFSRFHRTTTVTGIVLAPDIVSDTESLLKNIPSWSVASGDNFDFYWPGHKFETKVSLSNNRTGSTDRMGEIHMEMMRIVPESRYFPDASFRHVDKFSADLFREFVDNLHRVIDAQSSKLIHCPKSAMSQLNRHSGEIDLLLFDTVYNPNSESTRLDFGSGIMLHMSALSRRSNLITAHNLFESIRNVLRDQECIDQSSRDLYEKLNLRGLGLSKSESLTLLVISIAVLIGGVADAADLVALLFE